MRGSAVSDQVCTLDEPKVADRYHDAAWCTYVELCQRHSNSNNNKSGFGLLIRSYAAAAMVVRVGRTSDMPLFQAYKGTPSEADPGAWYHYLDVQ